MSGLLMKVPARRELRLALVAEALAFGGLAGWAAVFVPHAQREVGLAASTVTIALVVAAVLAAITMRAAGGIAPARRLPALLIGVLTLGAGLLASTVGVTTIGLLTSLAPVAIGFGLVAALTPSVSQPAEAARFAVAQLGTGAAAAIAGVLVAIWVVAAGADYRTVFALGGFAALAAAVPILRLEGAASPGVVRAVGRRAAQFAGWTLLLLVLAVFVHRSALLEADKAGFEALHGLGATPHVVESLLVEPSLRNYVIILFLASLVGARLWGRTTPGRTLLLVAGSGIVAYVAVRTCWALWERPRPEEVLAVDPVNGHSWAAYPSFPSGHVAVTTALALATATLVPKLRYLLWAYALVIAFTRLAYGAHFPSDVIFGFVIGYLAVRTTLAPLGAASSQVDGRSETEDPRARYARA
jgi:membrane-associated phospholipid phosphatase